MPILDDATTEALIAQHGPNLEIIELDYFDGPIVVRPPKSEEWRLFRDDTGGIDVDDRIAHLGQVCTVFPAVDLVNQAAKDHPAISLMVGNVAVKLSGFQRIVTTKKLERPSKTQR